MFIMLYVNKIVIQTLPIVVALNNKRSQVHFHILYMDCCAYLELKLSFQIPLEIFHQHIFQGTENRIYLLLKLISLAKNIAKIKKVLIEFYNFFPIS
jgi:hypothetical protein